MYNYLNHPNGMFGLPRPKNGLFFAYCCFILGLLLSQMSVSFVYGASDPEVVSADVKSGKTGKSKDLLLGSLKPDSKQKSAPIYIKAETLEVDSAHKIFKYKGDVEVKQGPLKITSDLMTGYYTDGKQINKILCEGHVVISKGESLRANAEKAVYNVLDATIVLSSSPELHRDGNILTADKISIYINEDRSEAEGDVRVKMLPTADGANILSSDS